MEDVYQQLACGVVDAELPCRYRWLTFLTRTRAWRESTKLKISYPELM